MHKLARSGHRLYAGKQEVASIQSSEPEEAIEWLRRQLLTFPEGTTLGEIEATKPHIPETPVLAKKALTMILEEEQRVVDLLAIIKDKKKLISGQLKALFEQIDHPPIK